jgi:NAD(P)-dependent dehydrogenase (short-subunit alcohol dehydrogenase family)
MRRFEDKRALVTGAASGIGLATANRLASEGATVVAAILDEPERPSVEGFDAQVLDVRREADWRRVLAHVESAHGGLDVLVNNAGVHRAANAEATTREVWDAVMEVNLYGAFLGCRTAIPLLRSRGGGAIVNVSSFAGRRGTPNQIAYAISKGAIVTMTMALACDHVADRIRVNCVCPAFTDTPMVRGLAEASPDPAAFYERIAAITPMARMATADEVAAAVAYLASDDASYTTGIALPVDGGRSGR